jgi:hypothetical protein
MRKFFSFGASKASDDNGSASTDHSRDNLRSREATPRERPTISPLVSSAATSLSEAIEEILCDTNSLTGENATGFLKLIQILQDGASCVDLVSISRSRGIGCLQVLLDNAHHASFIETCNQTNLVTGLMHSLRILRMYEIKMGKEQLRSLNSSSKLESLGHEVSGRKSVSIKGTTFLASERACAVFRRLCSDPQTIEKIRPSLIKFITFPLFPFPRAAIHLQDHAASVLNQMCISGLNSQQVWYLHDSQVACHIIKSLQDLTGLSTTSGADTAVTPVLTPGSDCLLRGSDAEQCGLWFTALSCVVTLISASATTGTVLISDFEIAGGHNLLTTILENTSADRLIMSLNIVIKLLFDKQKRSDDPVAFPNAAGIIYDLLLRSLGVERGVDIEDGIDKMVSLGHTLYEARERITSRQHVIQNISYCLLTLYSNDPRNCNVLEERFHFLPTLVISIPALSSSDSISAVLTALNYVCQCIDTASTLPLLSLCAAATVIVFSTLHCDKSSELEREVAMNRLEAVYCSIDVMIRSHSRFAITLVRCGMLEHLICGPIEQLRSSIWQGSVIEEWSLPIYLKLVGIIIAVNRKNPFVADEIRKCGLQLMVRDLIKAPAVSSSFASELLVLLEDLAQRDTSHLEEAIQSFVDLLRHTRLDYLKMARILNSLSSVMLRVDEAAHVWYQLNGFSSLLEVLGSLDGVFLVKSAPRIGIVENNSFVGNNPVISNAFECVKCTIRCMATDAATNLGMSRYAPETDSRLQRFKINNRRFCRALRNTGIFSPSCPHAASCVDALFWLLSGGSTKPIIVNPHSVIAVVELLPHLSCELASQALSNLLVYAECRIDSIQELCSAGLVRMLAESFRDITHGDKKMLTTELFNFIKRLMSSCLLVDDFMCILENFVRADVLVDCSNGKLLSPWKSSDPLIKDRLWEGVGLLESLATNRNVDSTPYLCLGTRLSTIKEQAAYASVFLSEASILFPQNAFSFSAWVKPGEGREFKDCKPTVDTEVIPLVALSAFSVGGCFFEAHFDAVHCFVRIMVRKGKKIMTLRFKPTFSLNLQIWQLIVICYKRGKRFAGSKSQVAVYFNGIQGISATMDSVDFDIPTVVPVGSSSATPVELAIGKNAMELYPLHPESAVGDEELLQTFRVAQFWQLGPTHLFEDTLTTSQVAVIFIRGPTYVGTYQADSPLSTSISNFSCAVLRMCNATELTADKYIDQLVLKGIELVVEPKIEASAPVFVEISSLPVPLLTFSAKNLISVQLSATSPVTRLEPSLSVGGSEIAEKTDKQQDKSVDDNDVWGYRRISLQNMATNLQEKSPEASLMNGQFCFSSESIASCVAACGGPHILFPILQAASTSNQIVSFLKILQFSVLNAANLKFMQSNGYKVCAYILSVKPKHVISTEIIDAIFDIIVDRKWNGEMNSYSVLLVDTTALHYLLLNTQVWDFSVSSYAVKILELVVTLTNDHIYGQLNRKRLSSLGIVKSILNLLMFGADLSCRNTLAQDPLSEQCWHFQIPTMREACDGEDAPDSFLKLATTALEDIINVEMRQKDLEQILNCVLHTLIPQYNQGQFVGEGALQKASLLDPDLKQEPSLSAMCLTRIYLLRYLLDLLERCRAAGSITSSAPSKAGSIKPLRRKNLPVSTEGSPVINVFKSALSVEWFLTVQEKIADSVTWALYLRLLGSMLECIPGFQYEFCGHDGVSLIGKQLFTISLDVSVIIPLLGLLFKIPMASLPYKIQHSIDLVLLLGNDDCMGPDVNEPWLSTVTIPVLGLVLNSLVTWRRINSDEEPVVEEDTGEHDVSSIITDVIVEMMKRAHRQYEEYRRLLQCRGVIEILASSMLSCSNAVDEYGTHILAQLPDTAGQLNSPGPTVNTVDITSLIILEYINNDGRLSVQPSQMDAQSSLHNETVHQKIVKQLTIVGREGNYLVDVLSNVMTNAVTEFDHWTVLSSFMLSFPRNLVDSFATSFHLYLIKLFDHVVTNLLEKRREEPHILHLQAIANTLTSLVPLSRARVIDDCVQIEVLTLSIRLLKYLTLVAASRVSSLLDKLNTIIKDVGTTCRFFAISCVQAVTTERRNSEELRLALLRTVRSNMDTFLLSIISEELSDFANIGSVRFRRTDSTAGSELADKGAGTAVLEAFQISWSSETSLPSNNSGLNRKGVVQSNESAQLSIAQADKTKLSQLFTIANVCFCCGLVFDDNIAIRQEALRLFSLLAISRSHLIEQLIMSASSIGKSTLMKMAFDSSNNSDDSHTSKSLRAAQLFMEGVEKLVPVNVGAYVAYIRGEGVEEDGVKEEQRFADFSYWFADNSSKCARILNPIETYLQSITTSGADVDDIVRQIQTFRVKEDMKGESAKSVLVLMKRAEEGQRLGELITTQVRKWRVHGLMSLAVGAHSWWRVWNALQSSPVWGYKPRAMIIQDFAKILDDSTEIELAKTAECSLSITTASQISLFDRLQRTVAGSFPQLWKLNFIEGPERSRRRLELDFSAQVAALWAPVDDNSLLALTEDGNVTPRDREDATLTEANVSAADIDAVMVDSHKPASHNQIMGRPASEFPVLEHKSSMESFLQSMSAEALLQLQHSAVATKSVSFDVEDVEGEVENQKDVVDTALDIADSADSFICRLGPTFSLGSPVAVGSAKDSEDTTDDAEDEHDVDDGPFHAAEAETVLFRKAEEQILQTVSMDSSSVLSPLNTAVTEEARRPAFSPKECLTDRRGPPQRRLTLVSNKKTMLALEIVKGLVSPSEWNSGRLFNVERLVHCFVAIPRRLMCSIIIRIHGLEAQPALLVLTATNLHIINGFRCKFPTARRPSLSGGVNAGHGHNNSDKTIEFVGSTSASAALDAANAAQWRTNRARVVTVEAPSFEDLYQPGSFVGRQMAEDSKWILEVWEDLLSSDNGYTRLALKDVSSCCSRLRCIVSFICNIWVCGRQIYSIFKRRHQLKSCAIELADIHGLSVLFAFNSVPVSSSSSA